MSVSGGGTNFLTRGVEVEFVDNLRFDDLGGEDLEDVALERKKECRVDEGRAFSTRFLDVEAVGIVEDVERFFWMFEDIGSQETA